jgi:putative phosphoesterase
MKIGIIADTHGNLDGWRRAWEFLHDSDLIVHCGDLLYHGPRFDPARGYNPRELAEALNKCPVPLLITQGNADSEVDALFVHAPIQSPYVFAQVEGRRLLATHGHREPLEQCIEQAQKWRVDFLITAHLHVPMVGRYGDLLHLNPGTPTYPLSPDERLARPTCAALVDGEACFWALDTGEVLEVDA